MCDQTKPAKLSRKRSVCRTCKAVSQLLMNFGPTDRHIARGSEAQFHPISLNFQHNYLDVLANEDSLPRFSAQN